MSYVCFDVTEDAGVAHVRLDRPDELNTMIPEFWTELPELIGELSGRGRVRAIVISSTGRHFSAGMDLAVFSDDEALGGSGDETEPGRRRAEVREKVLSLQQAFTALEEARMPVLAAVQGGCVGGAVDMICAADCRYATADAWFCVQEINIGMTADLGTLQRLPKLVPDGIAREYAYTGRRLPAERAVEVGLVNAVFPDHQAMLDAVLELAGEIAAKSPLAILGTKEMLNYARDHAVDDSLRYMAAWQSGMFQPADMIESFTAQAEGRPPVFDDILDHRPGI